MRKCLWGIVLFAVIGYFWSLDATQTFTWLEVSSVTVEDAVWLVESLDNPLFVKDNIKWEKYSSLTRGAKLTAGKLAKILLIAGKMKPGFFIVSRGGKDMPFLLCREGVLWERTWWFPSH